MKRRDVLKGVAVAAGAAVVGMPAVAQGARPCCERDHDGDGNCDRHPEKVHIYFSLTLPGPYEHLADQLKEGIEGLEAQWPDMRVLQPMTFELFDQAGEPWLRPTKRHPHWETEERALRVDRTHIFEHRHWTTAQKVVDLCGRLYWGQEVRPKSEPITEFCQITWDTNYLALPGGECRACRVWREEHQGELGSVHIAFTALVTPRPADMDVVEHAASDPDMTIHVNNRVKA
jgi:hypothetical protein